MFELSWLLDISSFINVSVSCFLSSECITTTITNVFFIISAPSTKKFADIDYWNDMSYVIVVVQSVRNNFLWRKHKHDINNLLSFQLLMCVRRKVKRFPSFMKFFLCCVWIYVIGWICLHYDVWVILLEIIDIYCSYMKIHSFPTIVIKIFFVLRMTFGMLSMFVIVMKWSTKHHIWSSTPSCDQ